jgi:RimJ/RimL family protein N-acetyltransferase
MRLEYRELRTDRLLLRRPREGDAAAVFESFGADPEVARFLAWPRDKSKADAQAVLIARIERLANGIEYSWMIELSETRRLVGVISAWFKDDAAEVGFVLARSYWNQGLTTEAVLAVRDWALASPEVSRLWATCDVENRASGRVLEKAGFTNLGLFEREIVRPNLDPRPRPSLLFTRSAAQQGN